LCFFHLRMAAGILWSTPSGTRVSWPVGLYLLMYSDRDFHGYFQTGSRSQSPGPPGWSEELLDIKNVTGSDAYPRMTPGLIRTQVRNHSTEVAAITKSTVPSVPSGSRTPKDLFETDSKGIPIQPIFPAADLVQDSNKKKMCFGFCLKDFSGGLDMRAMHCANPTMNWQGQQPFSGWRNWHAAKVSESAALSIFSSAEH
jgi:hypothetical protein